MTNVTHIPRNFKSIEGNRSALEQIVTKVRGDAPNYPCEVACKMQEIADDIDILVFGKVIERAWTAQQWQAYADAAMEASRA